MTTIEGFYGQSGSARGKWDEQAMLKQNEVQDVEGA